MRRGDKFLEDPRGWARFGVTKVRRAERLRLSALSSDPRAICTLNLSTQLLDMPPGLHTDTALLLAKGIPEAIKEIVSSLDNELET